MMLSEWMCEQVHLNCHKDSVTAQWEDTAPLSLLHNGSQINAQCSGIGPPHHFCKVWFHLVHEVDIKLQVLSNTLLYLLGDSDNQIGLKSKFLNKLFCTHQFIVFDLTKTWLEIKEEFLK